VVGVFFIAFIVNGFNLNGVDPVYQRIIQGAVILTAVGADAWSRRDKS
jgi:ribose transport system permease protein